MFNFKELKKIHVELTSMCQASCPMCARNHHGGLPNNNLPIDEITFEQFKNIFTNEVLSQIEVIYFCGNYGDPIMSNHLIDIVKYCKLINSDIKLDIHTNGSARSINWWQELAKSLPEKHSVHFALDGLKDTHHLYRIGTDYNKIIKNAKAFIDEGGNAEWIFLKFKHNEHQVDEARQLASNLGFAKFVEKQTIRFVGQPWFDVYDKQGDVKYKLEPTSETKMHFIEPKVIKEYKKLVELAEINCKVIEDKSLYVDAFKTLWPCCWTGAVPYIYSDPKTISHSYQLDTIESINSVVRELGGYESISLLNHSIKDIINSSIWNSIWKNYWNDKKLPTCAKVCGKFPDKIMSQPQDQFLRIENL